MKDRLETVGQYGAPARFGYGTRLRLADPDDGVDGSDRRRRCGHSHPRRPDVRLRKEGEARSWRTANFARGRTKGTADRRLASATSGRQNATEEAPPSVADMHTAKTAIDWKSLRSETSVAASKAPTLKLMSQVSTFCHLGSWVGSGSSRTFPFQAAPVSISTDIRPHKSVISGKSLKLTSVSAQPSVADRSVKAKTAHQVEEERSAKAKMGPPVGSDRSAPVSSVSSAKSKASSTTSRPKEAPKESEPSLRSTTARISSGGLQSLTVAA